MVKRAALIVLAAAVLIIGWRAVRSFITFGAKARAAEARSNLKRLCQDPAAKLERGNRYGYFVSGGGEPDLQVDVERFGAKSIERAVTAADLPAGLLDAGVIIAVGNIDKDPELDVWSVSRKPPCEPSHVVVDVD